ncbi:aminoacyl-tRNA hydrolase [Coraliomargarita parva]|uniref:aminoacyl-tRNA hydrolase n=1 Tax=Coraliomargarita parva TaxID=3014050 RepID=UPI0022B3E583|nr:aminoacyl-tRNA hydrolase [Coraliomargarita parva]
MSIAVIAGLGNPGLKYRNTRHNVGFELVDALAERYKLGWKAEAKFEALTALGTQADGRKLLLVKPQTYMNASGRALGAILRYRKLGAESLLVCYDDLTLDFGRVKLSLNGSAGGHNGIADLLQQVGPGFARFRIGIGAKPEKSMDLADYVLSRFSKDEQETLAGQLPRYLDSVQLVVDKGIEPAMNIINQRTATEHERNNHQ